AQRLTGPAESGWLASASVCVGRGIPEIRPTSPGWMFNRRYPYAGNVRSRTADAPERRKLQDPDYLHHSTRRRENADAGAASRRRGVYGKTVQRRGTARECSGGSGKLSTQVDAYIRLRKEVLRGGCRNIRVRRSGP